MKKVSTSGLAFQDIRSDDRFYIDKSLLIKDILDTDDRGVYLYTRPRRFGKTVNITMLDAFFNIEYRGNNWFEGLAISGFPEYDHYRNAYPVIYIDLKDLIPPEGSWDFGFFLSRIRMTLYNTFDRFRYLLDSDKVHEEEKRMFRSIMDLSLSEEYLGNSVRMLCQMLERHHGRRAIVLIDEYDRAITNSFDTEMQRQVIGFFGDLLSSTLKGNRSLQMAYVTGVIQVAKAGMFSGLNNISVNDVFSTMSDERFGFTDSEVRYILDYFGHPDKFEEVRTWYDGYLFGNTEVYNPYSLMSYVQEGFRPSGYWSSSGRNTPLRWMLERIDAADFEVVTSIVAGRTSMTALHPDLSFEDLRTLRGPDLFSLMVMTGYLKAVPRGDGTFEISLPNLEVRSDLDRLLTSGRTLVDDKSDLGFCRAVLEGDAASVESYLNNILTAFNYHNLHMEQSYELIVTVTLKRLINGYDVRTEVQSGNGRTDIVMFPGDADNPGIVMELNRVGRPEDLDTAVEDAIRQIHDRRYYNGMKRRVVLYGIAFCGVVAKVGAEVLDL